MEDMGRSLEDFMTLPSAPQNSIKARDCCWRNVHDRIDRRAIFELPSKRMVDQFYPGLFLIALQGGIEEQPNPIVHPEGSLILGAEEI